MAILRELYPLTGPRGYVFPSVRNASRLMSENTLNVSLRRLGCDREDAIQRQLAHGERDKVRAAYNHADYLPERVKMMQSWADYLDTLRGSARSVTGEAWRDVRKGKGAGMANRNQTSALPAWYPLSTYERELTEGEWVSAILARFGFQAVLQNIEEGRLEDLTLEDHASNFASYLTEVRTSMDELPLKSPDRVFPVANMNRFEVAYLAHLAAPHSTTDELTWAQRLASEPRKWLAEFHDKRDDLSARGDVQSIFTDENINDSPDVLGFRLPLLVNVNLDDDTLKTCFYRKVTKPLVASVFSAMQVDRLVSQFELNRTLMDVAKKVRAE